jgi:hypothetical protein
VTRSKCFHGERALSELTWTSAGFCGIIQDLAFSKDMDMCVIARTNSRRDSKRAA